MDFRTLLYGEGLFETILWRGRTKKLERHYRRLKNSATFFKIPFIDYETFCQEIEKKTEGKKDLYVKFCLLTKGDTLYYSSPQSFEIAILKKEYLSDRTAKKLMLSTIKRHSKNPVIYHKTMNYLTNILVKREAMEAGFDDAVMLNERDEITECSASNIVILRKDKLFTPSQKSGLLLGTTLEILIEKFNIKEEKLTLKELYNANSVFITNSLIGALPASKFMDKTYYIDNEILNELNRLIDEENKL
ncbi:aminotransferase class IV [Thermodesulfovibrio sp.]|uniref:aminotransferase class IV n=1 Tax=Thermodesulfovibrio sp. TaxID=2067987 RepID=UPI0030B2B967